MGVLENRGDLRGERVENLNEIVNREPQVTIVNLNYTVLAASDKCDKYVIIKFSIRSSFALANYNLDKRTVSEENLRMKETDVLLGR